jgi:DNA polymerase-1
MPLQSLAADMMKMAILKVDEKYPDLKMMLSVHDELVFEVKKGEEKAWAEKIKPIMEEIYKLKVPVLVEAKAGPNWSEMEKLKI